MTDEPEFRIEHQLEALARPGVFPVDGAVEILETHISVVCLVADRAFKFKKAVRLPFVDFSTAALRRAACEEELRLNRRLCPAVYLEVAPLRRSGGALRVGGTAGGAVVDHAVVMQRLPQERMLDELLARDAVEPAAIDALARTVARFHARAATESDAEVRELGSPRRLIEQVRANFDDPALAAGQPFDPALQRRLRQAVELRIPALGARLDERAHAGRIVEGHGDLHARNICMTDPVTVYDCVEFRRDFRCGDVATDIAFLTMDLRARGRHDLAERVRSVYIDESRDRGLLDVLPELERYRAMVRAKVRAISAADPHSPTAARALAGSEARRYLRLCAFGLAAEGAPLLVIASGPPASGKSFLAAALGRETGWPVQSTDRVRKELAAAAPSDRLEPRWYAPPVSDLVYATVLERALAGGAAAIVDGNFPTVARRAAAFDAAQAAGRRVIVLQVDVPAAVAARRLAERSADPDAVSDANARVAEILRRDYVAPSADEGGELLRIDGAAPVDDALDRIAAAILPQTATPR